MMRVAALTLAMSVMACGGTSISDFQEQARAAKGCDPLADSCVSAGASACLCATPVNSKRAGEINDLAATVACKGATVSCAPQLNPRCINGTCVATQ